MSLQQLGWNNHFQKHFEQQSLSGKTPARVVAEYRESYRVRTENQEYLAEVTGGFRYGCSGEEEFPKVGDWVVATPYDTDKALIHTVLPRLNTLSRKKSGIAYGEQVLAANITVVCLVMGLDHDFNIRRLERYVALAQTMQCRLIVVLNKADLAANQAELSADTRRSIPGQTLLTISALQPADIDCVRNALVKGDTAVFLGSSGVGKSTIVNALCGSPVQETAAVRTADSHGRHTTTTRELFLLPENICIIDSPGIRELSLWSDDSDVLDNAFTDIAELAEQCRFPDCRHDTEPGCAVKAAIDRGEISVERWNNYLKLQREQSYLKTKVDEQAFRERKAKERKLHRSIRQVLRLKYNKKAD